MRQRKQGSEDSFHSFDWPLYVGFYPIPRKWGMPGVDPRLWINSPGCPKAGFLHRISSNTRCNSRLTIVTDYCTPFSQLADNLRLCDDPKRETMFTSTPLLVFHALFFTLLLLVKGMSEQPRSEKQCVFPRSGPQRACRQVLDYRHTCCPQAISVC